MRNAHYLFLSFFLLASCIGKVKDLQEPTEQTVEKEPTEIFFEGAQSAVGISHNKISVKFIPATGGSGDFSYIVYRDGDFSNAAGSIDGALVTVDLQGLASVQVDDLRISTSYTFVVKAYDKFFKFEDKNVKTVSGTTLSQVVPDFAGVTSLENYPGKEGETAILVRWNKSERGKPKDIFDPNNAKFDIAGYQISYGTDQSNLDSLLEVSGGDVIFRKIAGLESNTEYYFRVRAFDSHGLFGEQARVDANNKVLSLSTLKTEPIGFAGLKSATVPVSTDGFSRAILEWDKATGSFGVYQICVKQRDGAAVNIFDAVADSASCSITLDGTDSDGDGEDDLLKTSYTLNGLVANTTYDVGIIACDDVGCATQIGGNSVFEITTTPPVPNFGGIDSVGNLDGLEGLTRIRLLFTIPTLAQEPYYEISITRHSDLEGNNPIVVESCNVTGDTICFEAVNNLPSEVVVVGLTTDQDYFFKANIVNINSAPNGIPRFDSNDNIVKATPGYTRPAFSGINSCDFPNSTSSKVAFNWVPPLAGSEGTFNRYEVIIKKKESGQYFSLATATAKIDAGLSLENYTDGATKFEDGVNIYRQAIYNTTFSQGEIDGLAPATTYQLMVQTYYKDASDNVFRDENQQFLECTTKPVVTTFNGWFDVQAVGPRINKVDTDGDSGNHQAVYAEDEAVWETIPEMTQASLDSREHQAFVRGLDRYTWDEEGWQPRTNRSREGIIRIVWDDFSFTGSLTSMKALIDEFGSEGYGYNVYRARWATDQEGLNPPNPIGYDPDNQDPRWTKLNTDLIRPKTFEHRSDFDGDPRGGRVYVVNEFIDYSLDHEGVDASGIEVAANKDKSQIYWYKVEAVAGNQVVGHADLNATQDLLLQVALPPNNMSLIHRWIANRSMCENMAKGDLVERNKNYRCEYNGVTSVVYKNPTSGEQSKRYYDFAGHSLVNRFALSMKFSRRPIGSAGPGPCTPYTPLFSIWDDTGGTSGLDSFLGNPMYTDPISPNYILTYLGKNWDVNKTGLRTGDCLYTRALGKSGNIYDWTVDNYNGKNRMLGSAGSIIYDRWHFGAHYLIKDSGSKVDIQTVLDNPSILSGNEFNGIASHITNGANAPALSLNYNQSANACGFFQVSHKTEVDDMRIIRLKEASVGVFDYSAYRGSHTFSSKLAAGTLEVGDMDKDGNNVSTPTRWKGPSSVYGVDRDCSISSTLKAQNTELYPYFPSQKLSAFQTSAIGIKDNPSWDGFVHIPDSHGARNNSYNIPGTFGYHSIDRCQSRYGIQGNSTSFYVSDQFYCDFPSYTCSAGYTNVDTQTEFIPDHDPENRRNLRTVYVVNDNDLLKRTDYVMFSDRLDSMGDVLIQDTSRATFLKQHDSPDTKYLAKPLSLPFACRGDHCNSDDELFTWRLSGATFNADRSLGSYAGTFRPASGGHIGRLNSSLTPVAIGLRIDGGYAGSNITYFFKHFGADSVLCSTKIDEDPNIDWSK